MTTPVVTTIVDSGIVLLSKHPRLHVQDAHAVVPAPDEEEQTPTIIIGDCNTRHNITVSEKVLHLSPQLSLCHLIPHGESHTARRLPQLPEDSSNRLGYYLLRDSAVDLLLYLKSTKRLPQVCFFPIHRPSDQNFALSQKSYTRFSSHNLSYEAASKSRWE
jgi:hypothetical protein